MSTIWQRFGERLAAAGITADPVLPPRPAADAPWYVLVAVTFAAWFAAMLLLISLATASYALLEHGAGRAALGAIACVLCLRLARRRRSPFGAQFTTAISLAGAALLASAPLDLRADAFDPTLLWTAIVAAALWWLNPEPGHRHVTAIALVAALSAWTARNGMLPIALAVCAAGAAAVWLGQARAAAAGVDERLRALGIALMAATLILPLGDALITGRWTLVSEANAPAVRAAFERVLAVNTATLACVLAAVAVLVARATPRVADDTRSAFGQPLMLIGIAVLAIACWRVPGVLAAMLIWTLGMAAGRPLLVSLSLLGLAAYLFQYYYQLETTLQAKGLALLASGAVLLVARWIVTRRATR